MAAAGTDQRSYGFGVAIVIMSSDNKLLESIKIRAGRRRAADEGEMFLWESSLNSKDVLI